MGNIQPGQFQANQFSQPSPLGQNLAQPNQAGSPFNQLFAQQSQQPNQFQFGQPNQPQFGQPNQQQVGQQSQPGLQFNNSQYGRILTDQTGRTLYIYTKDPAGQSACYGQCATDWPPLGFAPVTSAQIPQLGNGVVRSALGNITRNDGTLQLTYNKWPLYYYYLDKKAGDVNGQTVNGIWYVIGQNGPIIQPLIPQNQPNSNQMANLTPAIPAGQMSAPTSAPIVNGQLNGNSPQVQQYQQWKQTCDVQQYKRYSKFNQWRNHADRKGDNWKSYSGYKRWSDGQSWGDGDYDNYSDWIVTYAPEDFDNWKYWNQWRDHYKYRQ